MSKPEQDVVRKAGHLFVPLPDHLRQRNEITREKSVHLHAQLFKGVNEHLDLLLGHLVGLEGGAKGYKDGSLGGRVHELLEVALQRLGILQLKSTNLGINHRF